MGLSHLDLAIVAVYLVAITLFGLRFRTRQRSMRDYFLADRNVPWWAIALSIVAAETSTLTIISIPGLAYDSDLRFLQVVMGYMLARVVISSLLLPHYFRGELFTAYQLIERRFGQRLRTLTAGLFLLTRAAAEGVRVFAVSIVVRAALGALLPTGREQLADITAIALVTVLTLIYTFEGGMVAVIWTDVVQMIIYVLGTLVGFFTLVHLTPGGWDGAMQVASHAHKLRIFDFGFDLTKTYTFWSGVIGGTFLTMASHGTDQLMVQRLLSARNQGDARKALYGSGVAVFVQFTFFLLIGVLLFAFYSGQAAHFTRSDAIFPSFIVSSMPKVVSGILIAAILAAAMSNLSAALNSLSSTAMIDFYLCGRSEISERERLWTSRLFTLGWAVVLFVLAILSRGGGRVVEIGLSIAAVAYGALLGVFLLGTLTRRATETGAICGMLAGFVVNLWAWLMPLPALVLRWNEQLHGPLAGVKLAWTWYVVLGVAVTFTTGWMVSVWHKQA